MYLLCSYHTVMNAACNLICLRLDPHKPALNFITWMFICLSAQPPSCLQESPWQEEQRQDDLLWIHVCLLNDNIYSLQKRQDTQSTGEKIVKLGWNGGGEQCRRAVARFYGLGSCSQPPTTRSLFLPAMYCSLHMSHYEPHFLREARQNNEAVHRRGASV